MDIVDCHAHLSPPSWRPHGRMPATMFDVPAFLAARATSGVATSVVSDPHIWYGDLDPASIECTRDYNDFVAELARAHPREIVGLGTVTPWRADEHLAEAERAVRELGLAGLAVATSDRDQYLDAVPDAFWELVADLGVCVFVHPGGTVVGQQHMGEYRLGEICGRPLDMTLTLARFVMTGVAERHPGVRLLCAHAGGAICAVADRLDFGHELRDYAPLGPWGEVELAEPPSSYVSRLYLDTVTYGPALLRLALDRVGRGRVVYGSDNPPVPFPLDRTLSVVRGLGLPDDDEARVLGGNARQLLRSTTGRGS